MSKKRALTTQLLCSSMLTGAAFAALPAMASAQEEAADEGDVIQVTGSRIIRTDTIAPSPVTNVSEELMELNNVVNTEDILNSLPQLVPAFDATSNNPGNGTATASLRGLGTTRTLVLVDGTRFVGSGAANVVDLNNIPAALVENIDVVTGGASAVYGSDAVAGVVNFILKDDFEGVELNASHEFSTEEGDAQITDISAVMGGNFDNGRGNVVIHAGYTHREQVLQGDRDFSSLTFFDPGPGNAADGFIEGGSSNAVGGRWLGPGFCCYDRHITETGDVKDFDVPGDLYNYAPPNFLQLPQERHAISAFGNYEINRHFELYGRMMFSNNVVESKLANTPTGVIGITVHNDNPLIPGDLLTDIVAGGDNGDGTSDLLFLRRMLELDDRAYLRDTNTFQGVFGMRGELNEDWSYDVFYNFSRSSVAQALNGNISTSALQLAVLCDGGPTASTLSQCAGVPAANIYGETTLSDEAATFIQRDASQIDVIEQSQFVATVNGSLSDFASPYADAAPAVVAGFEYREATANIKPDSVLGPDVRGFNQSLPIQGGFDVYEFFGEVDVPLVTGQPGVESLNFTGAFRISDYSSVGDTQSYAAGLGWEPVEGLRIRGNYNRAVRAPNVGDLFAPLTNGFPGASDPCSGGTFGGFDSGVIVQNCIDTGVPAGQVGAAFQGNGQIEALFGGNPDLTEETADTFTIGAVWQPAQVDGLTVQLDYYNIEIEDAIATVSLQNRLNECYRLDIQEACDIFNGARDPSSGAIINPFTPNLSAANVANLTAEGVDLRVDYLWDAEQIGLSPDLGSFGLNYYATFTTENSFETSPAAGVVACEGTYGQVCGEPTPEYKHLAQASWYFGRLTTSIRWRHIGEVTADATTLPQVSDLSDDIEGTNYFDVTLGYDVNDNARVTLGIQNVADEDPPVLGSTASEQANTWPATYDPFGRRLFLGASLRF
ncbi:TonB-dependent receptor [Marinicauda salina]|uniref:TonB-dependent receptor n=1 Tax=Marinicauda salina TaxID=2135793 RepID=A0A2U2BRD5_9PROT|nr:TonB-dependent receptor [Marinicauda salina]PWE16570.1 TonB-dependent receptor [Marinicauda salina]